MAKVNLTHESQDDVIKDLIEAVQVAEAPIQVLPTYRGASGGVQHG